MSARTFTFSVLRRARPLAVFHAHLPRRTMWGFGDKPQQPPPAFEPPTIDPATKLRVQNMFKDKPDAVNALVKFVQVMEDSGVKVTAGRMPGPMQLFKLSVNPKFKEAYAEVQAELQKAGIDINSKVVLLVRY
ncbi:hypothetical protein B0H17DRAFT_1047518 [Mycena rosella]|uniref:Uncharacterized protein n=1 Tax=Mycena rosella TaxID=1033263 RepID=A0AAD7GPT7_MYCRO|nr:hypothetical protein B0H17DRAFT_1047518 [Mycena rosella]